ncbi:McrB family protein [Vibrio cholerae]
MLERFEEFISSEGVSNYYTNWDDEVKNHFKSFFSSTESLLKGFDVWKRDREGKYACGYLSLNGTKENLFSFTLQRKKFVFTLKIARCTHGVANLTLGTPVRDKTIQYYRWNNVNFAAELNEFLSILNQNINESKLRNCIPTDRKGYLPHHYSFIDKFSFVSQFQKRLSEITPDAFEAFCKIITISREFSLDCFAISPDKIIDIRIGRKEKSNVKADAVFAKFFFRDGKLRYEIREEKGEYIPRKNVEKRFGGDVNNIAIDEFQERLPTMSNRFYEISRAPYWPSDYNNDSSDLSESTEQPSKESSMQTPSLNQILFGPPGTGKTYHTIEKAVQAAEPSFTWNNREALKVKYKELVAKNRIRFVTFHQSYGYEEFVEGLSVKVVDGQPHYFVKNGIFKRIVEDANRSFEGDKETQNYVLVIDEINRGNISKIFGELITLIEESKRRKGNDETNEVIELDLPYSSTSPESPDYGKKFSVPNNLFLIGTMNTADRSLAVMDTALRRRFDFIEMMPDSSVLTPKSSHADFKIDLVKLLDTMNARIEYLLDREHTLGHAFFIPVVKLLDDTKPTEAFLELKKVFQNKVLPLLQEYFFDDWHKIRLVLGDNQKQDQTLAFVISQPVELKTLFGSDELNQFGESEKKFVLSKHDSAVWSDFNAYKGIYEALS